MLTSLGLLVLRVVIGLTLAGHGAQKLFGWWGGPGIKNWTAGMNRMRIRPAGPWAWISALAEFAGGLLLALGLLSPVGSFAIAASMIVAMALVHWAKGFWNTKGGYEFTLSIIGAVVALALTGPGYLSLDQALRIHLPEPASLIVCAVAVALGVGVALGTRAPEAAEERKTQPT